MKKDLPSYPTQITLSFIDDKWKMLIIGEILATLIIIIHRKSSKINGLWHLTNV